MGQWFMQIGMEWDSGHANRNGMGQWFMQRGMEWDSGSCKEEWNGTAKRGMEWNGCAKKSATVPFQTSLRPPCMEWDSGHAKRYGMGQWSCKRGMEWDSGHAKRYGMGQWSCKEVWNGTVVMQRGMEWDSGHAKRYISILYLFAPWSGSEV